MTTPKPARSAIRINQRTGAALFKRVKKMEIEKIINGLKTAKDKIEKEINFLESVDITSGAECCELYIKENGLEFIADEIRGAYHAGFIKAYRKRLEK